MSYWCHLFMMSWWDVWQRHLCVSIRERHCHFSACTQCCSRYNTVWTCHVWQVCVCGQRHWNIYKLLTQDRTCFPVVWDFNYGNIADQITNCCNEISDPSLIHIASRIARIMIQSKQDHSWNPIRSRNHELARNYWSDRKCQDYVYIKWEYWSTM